MSWFNCKVTYEKEVNQSGKIKNVSENYLVDAESFADAEFRLAEYLENRGVFITDSVRKMRIYELFMDHKSQRFYKAKVGFISLDEKAGVEKKKYVQMVIQADSLGDAINVLINKMKDTLSNYEIHTVSETQIIDIII